MTKQAEFADALEAASADLERFIGACSDADWFATTDSEGWTRAALAYHCASGNDVALAWICEMLDWRPVRETGDTHNAANADDALRHARASKQEVLDALHRTTHRTARFLRALSDSELERGSMHGLAGREMTVAQFAPNFARHIRGHLESLRATS